jgi:hypothetical protein
MSPVAPAPQAPEPDRREGADDDPLLDRWLATPPPSRTRIRIASERPPSLTAAEPPIGDELADGWFK